MPLIKILALFTVALIAFPVPIAADPASKVTARAIVESYTQAYNDSDAEAMGEYMHDDIQWITIEGDRSSITSQGKGKLIEDMAGFFKGPIKITSRLHGWNENGAFVSVIETATWTTTSGIQKSQSANAIYQLENGLIRRVWYFPAQQTPD